MDCEAACRECPWIRKRVYHDHEALSELSPITVPYARLVDYTPLERTGQVQRTSKNEVFKVCNFRFIGSLFDEEFDDTVLLSIAGGSESRRAFGDPAAQPLSFASRRALD
jgi:hypothetical protein